MTSDASVFLFGTLCDPELLEIVAGEAVQVERATLRGYKAFWVQGGSYPKLVETEGGEADGRLAIMSHSAKARLDFYEFGFGYDLRAIEVQTSYGPVQSEGYFSTLAEASGEAWSLVHWQNEFGELSREAAVEYMRLAKRFEPSDAAKLFPQVRSRAASRLRAMRANGVTATGKLMADAVQVKETSQPYTDFFAVREDVLQFPKFDGELSTTVKRASFLGGDAVTVLPYDPVTQNVLVVRQFRHGAFVRGDPYPWCIEPPAGRIDVGENAEEAAFRELREETGLSAKSMCKIASYYPTPGAFSEHITSFVAVCNLADVDGHVGGVAGEAEDILSEVIPLEKLLAMVQDGSANTGPLVMSALWLQQNRETLSKYR